MLAALLIVAGAYLIGSVSFAVVVSRAYGLPDPHGISRPVPIDEDGAETRREPADHGPGPDLRFRNETRVHDGEIGVDVDPGHMVADKQQRSASLRRAIDLQSQAEYSKNAPCPALNCVPLAISGQEGKDKGEDQRSTAKVHDHADAVQPHVPGHHVLPGPAGAVGRQPHELAPDLRPGLCPG